MNSLILAKPTKNHEKDAIDYKKEYIEHGETRINGSCGFTYYDNYDEWLKLINSIEHETLSRDKVNASTFFSIRKNDNKIIGTIQLRHSLTDELKKYGGHIGFGIRPKERLKGYATEQLALVLEEAKKLNISRVMISCDKNNIGSAKVITNKAVFWNGKVITNIIAKKFKYIGLMFYN